MVSRSSRSRRSRSQHRRHRSRSSSYDRDRRRLRSPSRSRSRRSRSDSRGRPSPTRNGRIRVDSPEPSTCLGIFGLSRYTAEPELLDVFRQHGDVEKLTIIRDPQEQQSRGFGFVYYRKLEEAATARKLCNGRVLNGRRIRVDYSITDRPHLPTPGIFMGRRDSASHSSSRLSSTSRSHRISKRSSPTRSRSRSSSRDRPRHRKRHHRRHRLSRSSRSFDSS